MAPSGAGGAGVLVCVRPWASVARTCSVYEPGAARHCQDHCRQVSADTAPARVAGCHAPSSTCTSTRSMPVCGAQATPATVTVAGVAWAQHTGVAKVEVQVDGGPWQEAALADTVSADTWRQWYWNWPATPGDHAVRVRATDAAGRTQTSTPAPPAPDGATGWHTVQVAIE